MSERKKGGGLDYTPRAFHGARAPDGPAADLEEKLAKLGLLEPEDAEKARAEPSDDARTDTARTRKRSSLDYTPRAFHGARAPDGPAPDVESRLVAMGLAEPSAPEQPRRDARRDAGHGVSSTARIDRAAAPSASSPHRVSAASGPQAAPTRSSSLPPSAGTGSPTRSERPEPAPEPPQRAEKAAPIPPPPASVSTAPSPAPLPRVPPEAAPRPLPVSGKPAMSRPVDVEAPTPPRSTPRTPRRTTRGTDRLPQLPRGNERARLSVRLEPSVNQKLGELAELRGLDRNTAVSVAIVQDWVNCFGWHWGQARRS